MAIRLATPNFSRNAAVLALAFLALAFAPAPAAACCGVTLHPLVGVLDPGGLYWGLDVRSQIGLATLTFVYRHNDLRGEEWRVSYQHPLGGPWSYRFDLALNEKRDAYDIDRLPEVTLLLAPLQLGTSPLRFSAEVSAGALFERQSDLRTVRGRALLTLATDPFSIGPIPLDITWAIGGSWYATAVPQQFATFTIGSTLALSAWSSFRLAYTRRWVDGASPFGFDRLDPLSEASGTLSVRLGGDFRTSVAVVYGFFAQGVTTRDYALTYAPAGGTPVSLVWHDVTQKWGIQVQQTF